MGRCACGVLGLCMLVALLLPACSGQGADVSSGGVSTPASQSSSSSAQADRDIPVEALIACGELKELLDAGEDISIIDVRAYSVFANLGSIEGARNIPTGRQFTIRLDEVPKDRTVVLAAQEQADAAGPYGVLMENDYDPGNVRVLEGGMEAWAKAGYKTVKTTVGGC